MRTWLPAWSSSTASAISGPELGLKLTTAYIPKADVPARRDVAGIHPNIGIYFPRLRSHPGPRLWLKAGMRSTVGCLRPLGGCIGDNLLKKIARENFQKHSGEIWKPRKHDQGIFEYMRGGVQREGVQACRVSIISPLTQAVASELRFGFCLTTFSRHNVELAIFIPGSPRAGAPTWPGDRCRALPIHPRRGSSAPASRDRSPHAPCCSSRVRWRAVRVLPVRVYRPGASGRVLPAPSRPGTTEPARGPHRGVGLSASDPGTGETASAHVRAIRLACG